MAILDVRRLKISFRTNNGTVKAVRDISFSLQKGKTLAIVGESGSGKSVTSRAILGISAGNAIIESGEIIYDGHDLLKLNEKDMYHIRGDKIAMIFQDPLSSLNPIVRIGKQITEAMILKNKATRREAKRDFKHMLSNLKIAMHECAVNSSLDEEKIDDLIATFYSFVLVANKLENAFNVDVEYLDNVSSLLKDTIMKVEHNYKVDVSMCVKSSLKKLGKIRNEYFLLGIKGNIEEISSSFKGILTDLNSLKANKENSKTFIKEKTLPSLKHIEETISSIQSREALDFFRLGYYLRSKEESLLNLSSFKEINKETSKYFDEHYLSIFSSYSRAALEHSVYKSLEYKKEAVRMAKDIRLYLVENELDKKTFKELVKAFKPIVKASIDPLKSQKDSVAYIISSSLLANCNKYFASIKANEKDEVRYTRQMNRYNKKIEKGKQVDYKVVPQKIIDLADIKSDMISSLDALITKYESSIRKFDGHNYQKWDKVSYLLVEYLKEKAKEIVYKLTKTAAKEKAIKLMEEVSIPEARSRFRQYPFEFSGGMRQRIVIAIALSAEPEILICDEPTTALDVTIQSQILELINELKAKRNLSIIFITHDLGVVANMADDIAVMYAGKIVEYGTSSDIFYSPAHPYTWALLSSMPDLDTKDKLEAIPGTPPNMIYPPKGDAFAARNKYALKIDYEEEPPMFKISESHYAATWLLDPRAPKVDLPKAIKERINRMKRSETGAK